MFTGCEFKIQSNMRGGHDNCIMVQRYDRLESQYLSAADYSALQQMNMDYPVETRMLLEEVLKLGSVEDVNIYKRLLHYYQDSTLQTLVADVEIEYSNMDDVNEQFCKSFHSLQKWLPNLPKPMVYAQIGSFDQSIVVGNGIIGIMLDKYMGANYPLYKRFYTKEQMQLMDRDFIVPDAWNFYLLSMYPLERYEQRTQVERDLHMAKLMWTVNRAMGKRVLQARFIEDVDKYMKKHPNVSVEEMIKSDNYRAMLP